MDLMRQVLGDDKLHYFGISYGTELGGVYAHLFPKKRRAGPSSTRSSTRRRTPNRARSARPRASSSPSTTSPRTARPRRRTARSATPRRTSRTGSPTLLERPGQQADPGGLPARADPDAGHQRHRAGPVLQGLLAVPHRGPRAGVRRRRQAADAAVRLDERAQRERRVQQPPPRRTSPSTAPTTSRATPPARRGGEAARSSARPPRCSATTWPGACSAAPTGRCAGAADHPDVSAPARPRSWSSATPATRPPRTRARRRWWRRSGKGVGVELTYKGEGHGAYNSENTCVQRAVNGYLLDGKVPEAGTVCA